MFKQNKKGYSIQDLIPLTVAFLTVAVVIGITASVLGSIQDTHTGGAPLNASLDWTGDAAYNATGDGLTSLTTMSSYLPTLAIVVIAAVIIGVIIVYFRFN